MRKTEDRERVRERPVCLEREPLEPAVPGRPERGRCETGVQQEAAGWSAHWHDWATFVCHS